MSVLGCMWRLIRYRPRLYAASLASWILIVVAELLPGPIVKAFFDTVTGTSSFPGGVVGVIVVSLLAALFYMGSVFAGHFTDTRYRFFAGTLLRRNLLSRLLSRPGAKAMPISAGELISRFRDDVLVIEDVVAFLIELITVLLFSLGALAIMLSVDLRVTLVAVLPLIAVILGSRLASSRLRSYRERSRAATEHYTGALAEVLGLVQAVQLANAEPHVRSHLEELGQSRAKAMVRDGFLTHVLHSVFANMGVVGLGLVLIAAAAALRNGSFSIGDLGLFMYYLGYLTDFTSEIGDYLALYRQSGVSLSRLTKLLGDSTPATLLAHESVSPQDVLPPPGAQSEPLALLEVRGLTCRYPAGAEQARGGDGIEDVSFNLKRGEFMVITGRVGAGKTTLLRALLGLLPAQAGTVFWNGREVQEASRFFVPPQSAYTPQVGHLFSGTIAENILLDLPGDEASLRQAVHQAVLEQDVESMPHGLQTPLGSGGSGLSGGQAQRTAAARMFVRSPQLLVCDDLGSALDLDTERLLWQRLLDERSRAERPACLAVSHRREALRRADRVLVLKKGKVVGQGTLQVLLERCQEMQELWETAAREE